MARAQVCKKSMVLANGEKIAKMNSNTIKEAGGLTGLEFAFANGDVKSVSHTDFNEEIQFLAMYHGLSQKLGDEYSGVKGDADKAAEVFDSLYERMATYGDWSAESEGTGPRLSLVAEAIVRVASDKGREITVEQVNARLKEDTNLRNNALTDPKINAAYKAIQAERAAKRAAEAAEAAAESSDETVEFDLDQVA